MTLAPRAHGAHHRRQRSTPLPMVVRRWFDGGTEAPRVLIYGHSVVPRLRTVASQVMVPMVTPSTVARVPNLRSTSVPLSTMLDGFRGSETMVNVPAPSANRPTPLFLTVSGPPWNEEPAPDSKLK